MSNQPDPGGIGEQHRHHRQRRRQPRRRPPGSQAIEDARDPVGTAAGPGLGAARQRHRPAALRAAVEVDAHPRQDVERGLDVAERERDQILRARVLGRDLLGGGTHRFPHPMDHARYRLAVRAGAEVRPCRRRPLAGEAPGQQIGELGTGVLVVVGRIHPGSPRASPVWSGGAQDKPAAMVARSAPALRSWSRQRPGGQGASATDHRVPRHRLAGRRPQRPRPVGHRSPGASAPTGWPPGSPRAC